MQGIFTAGTSNYNTANLYQPSGIININSSYLPHTGPGSVYIDGSGQQQNTWNSGNVSGNTQITTSAVVSLTEATAVEVMFVSYFTFRLGNQNGYNVGNLPPSYLQTVTNALAIVAGIPSGSLRAGVPYYGSVAIPYTLNLTQTNQVSPIDIVSIINKYLIDSSSELHVSLQSTDIPLSVHTTYFLSFPITDVVDTILIQRLFGTIPSIPMQLSSISSSFVTFEYTGIIDMSTLPKEVVVDTSHKVSTTTATISIFQNTATCSTDIASPVFLWNNGTTEPTCTITECGTFNLSCLVTDTESTAAEFAQAVMVQSIVIPNAPTDIDLSIADETSISVTFTPVSNASSYTVTCLQEDQVVQTQTTTSTTIVLHQLSIGTSYHVSVSATNYIGTSPSSISNNITVPQFVVPPPTNLFATQSDDTKVTIRFTASPLAVKYAVINASSILYTANDVTSLIITNVAPCASFSVGVYAIDAFGNQSMVVRTPPITVVEPGRITSLTNVDGMIVGGTTPGTGSPTSFTVSLLNKTTLKVSKQTVVSLPQQISFGKGKAYQSYRISITTNYDTQPSITVDYPIVLQF